MLYIKRIFCSFEYIFKNFKPVININVHLLVFIFIYSPSSELFTYKFVFLPICHLSSLFSICISLLSILYLDIYMLHHPHLNYHHHLFICHLSICLRGLLFLLLPVHSLADEQLQVDVCKSGSLEFKWLFFLAICEFFFKSTSPFAYYLSKHKGELSVYPLHSINIYKWILNTVYEVSFVLQSF